MNKSSEAVGDDAEDGQKSKSVNFQNQSCLRINKVTDTSIERISSLILIKWLTIKLQRFGRLLVD